MKWRWVGVLASAALMASATASAAPEPPVLIALDRCDELDQVEVRRVFAAELGVRSVNSTGPGVTEATVICQGPRVIIRVYDPLSRKLSQRAFSLSRADREARPRLVSIAAAELVLASWSELQTNPRLQIEPEGPEPPSETARAAQRIAKVQAAGYEAKIPPWHDDETPDQRMFRVVGLVSTRGFFNQPGVLAGGGLRLGEERFRWMSWSADALFETGSVGEGDRYKIFTTTLGGQILLYGRIGAMTARIGAGLRAGLAEASAGQASGKADLAAWGWPLGATSLSFRLSESLVLDLSGEAGYVRIPVGGGERLLEGGWFGGQIGLGVIPGGNGTGSAAEAEE